MKLGRWRGRHTEHIVSELGVFQAQRFELLLGLGPQGVRAGSPEACDGRAHVGIVDPSVAVDVAGVGNLALGRRVDAVNLGARQGLELVDTVLLGDCVDARMLEQLVAAVVDCRKAWIGLEDALSWQLPGKVFAGV